MQAVFNVSLLCINPVLKWPCLLLEGAVQHTHFLLQCKNWRQMSVRCWNLWQGQELVASTVPGEMVVTSAEHKQHLCSWTWPRGVSGVVNDDLTTHPLFPQSGALLKSVILQEAIQSRSFSVCLSAPTSLFSLYRIELSLFGPVAEETKELHLRLPNVVVAGKSSWDVRFGLVFSLQID